MAVIVKKPTEQQLNAFKNRPSWEASAYIGKWKLFAADEFFLAAEGQAVLHCEGGVDVHCQAGDFVLIQKGTNLYWDVPDHFKKHF